MLSLHNIVQIPLNRWFYIFVGVFLATGSTSGCIIRASNKSTAEVTESYEVSVFVLVQDVVSIPEQAAILEGLRGSVVAECIA